MNKLLLPLLALFLTFPAFSQNSPQADPRVTNYFGVAKVQTWAAQNPDSIRYYNFLVSNSFEIWTAENAALRSDSRDAAKAVLSPENIALLGKPAEFNILTTGLKWSKDKNLWFIVEGTDYYVMLQSLTYIEKKFKAGK